MGVLQHLLKLQFLLWCVRFARRNGGDRRLRPLQRAVLEPLEARVFLTALAWYPVSNDNWDTSSTDKNWNTAYDGSGTQVAWTNGDEAYFLGNDTTVNISGTVAASDLQITGSDYTISGGSLSLGSATSQISSDTTINSVIAGGSGIAIEIEEFATVSFTGDNTYTGGTTITGGGYLSFTGDAVGALTAGTVTTSGSTFLQIGDSTFTHDVTSTSEVDIEGDVTLSGGDWYLGDGFLKNYGTLNMSGANITAYDFENYGAANLSGGSLTLNGDASSANGSSIDWTGGSLTVDSSVTLENAGDIAIDGSSLTLGGSGSIENTDDESGDGTLEWNGGNLTVSTNIVNDPSSTITLAGGSGILTLAGSELENAGGMGGGVVNWDSGTVAATGGGSISAGWEFTVGSGDTVAFGSGVTFSDGSLVNNGTLTIGGDLDFSDGTLLNDAGTITMDAGSGTLTLDDSTLQNGNSDATTVNWDSGNITLAGGGSIVNDDADGATMTVDSDAKVGLDPSGGSITGTITNNGTLDWSGTDTTYLPNVANDGDITFDDSVSLVSLGGDSTVDEGATYTLDIYSVSGDVPGTITDYYVDWGDGAGMDDFTATGDQTHVYAGSETSTTDYTVTVHLATADGVYVNTGTLGVTVDDVAPVVTLDDPGTTATTPTLTGTAGITPGDADTVTLNIYSGSTATGSPVVSTDVDVDPDTGDFAYTVDSGSPLAAGTYTFQAVQTEDAGNTGTSDPLTFTVGLQDPGAVTNLAATSASATEIDLTWDAAPASDYVNNFSVYYSTDYGATFTHYGDTTDGSATGMSVTGLTPNTAYMFNVVANNESGASPDNVALPTWTDDGIAAPTDLATSLVGGGMGGIELTWANHSTGATGIEIEAKWAGSGQFETIASLDADATSFDTSDWDSDGISVGWITENVTFRVRSVGTGESAYSDPATYTADTSFMGSGDVYGLTATAGTHGYNLTWTQPDDSPDFPGGYDFTVYARKQGDVPGEFGAWESYSTSELADSTTATIPYTALSWSDGMQFAVGSSVGGGLAVSNLVTLGMVQNLTAPTLDVHFDSDTGLYDFAWTSAGDGDISYEIINMGASGAGEESIAHDLAYAYDTTSVETSFQANGGYFAVLAYNSCGDVSISDYIDVDIAYTPGTPTAKAIVDDDGNNAISLEWANTSYNETGFEVQRSTDDATWATLTTVDPDVTSYVDSSVDADTTYYYQVIATEPAYGDPIILWSLDSLSAWAKAAPPHNNLGVETFDGLTLDKTTQHGSGAYVVLNSDNDNGGSTVANGAIIPKPDDDTSLEATTIPGEHDLVPIVLTSSGIAGSTYQLSWSNSSEIRIYVNSDQSPNAGNVAHIQGIDATLARYISTTTKFDADAGTPITLYVEGVGLSQKKMDEIITLNWAPPSSSAYTVDDKLPVTVYSVAGPQYVTDDSEFTYAANVPGGNLSGADGWTYGANSTLITSPLTVGNLTSTVTQWGTGPAVGSINYSPAPGFRAEWDAYIVHAAVTNSVETPPSGKATDYAAGSSTTYLASHAPGTLTWSNTVTLQGPTVNGTVRGIQYVNVGYAQTLLLSHLSATYGGSGSRTSSAQSTVASTDMVTSNATAKPLGTWPWADSTAVSKKIGGKETAPRVAYATNSTGAPINLNYSDQPYLPIPRKKGTTAFDTSNVQASFITMVVVQTRDSEVNLAVDDPYYSIAQFTWAINYSQSAPEIYSAGPSALTSTSWVVAGSPSSLSVPALPAENTILWTATFSP